MSYIIKNCPSILPMTKLCDSESMFNCGTYCKDCANCVIKQVIEKCKLFQNNYLVNDGVQLLTTNILNSFDIEEVDK